MLFAVSPTVGQADSQTVSQLVTGDCSTLGSYCWWSPLMDVSLTETAPEAYRMAQNSFGSSSSSSTNNNRKTSSLHARRKIGGRSSTSSAITLLQRLSE